MEYEAINSLRERHPAWRLLRAGNATLILSFLGVFFVEDNRGACPASQVAAALDDYVYALNTEIPTENGQQRFRRTLGPISRTGRPPTRRFCAGFTRPATTKSITK
ncbi:hypothetical protein LAUMK35_01552 [Mycobacterium pseudokansasii]|nr:hypothetical protein LAUMK35_01552 [Mycobacterium pseudokansasii]VAZ92205.1 hypothetical protein LAUMK21_01551 [Mycobacterium pseudokansasii]